MRSKAFRRTLPRLAKTLPKTLPKDMPRPRARSWRSPISPKRRIRCPAPAGNGICRGRLQGRNMALGGIMECRFGGLSGVL
eukprot:8320344-Alexandrium_andersonii.AAC.1